MKFSQGDIRRKFTAYLKLRHKISKNNAYHLVDKKVDYSEKYIKSAIEGYDKGACSGFSLFWARCVLLDKFSEFKNAFEAINNWDGTEHGLRKESKDYSLNFNSNKLVNIFEAIISNVIFLQNCSKHMDEVTGGNISQRDYEKLIDLVENKKGDKLEEVYSMKSFITNDKQLQHILKNIIKQDTAIMIGSRNHVISLFCDKKSGAYYVFDSNNGVVGFRDIKKLPKTILRFLSVNKYKKGQAYDIKIKVLAKKNNNIKYD